MVTCTNKFDTTALLIFKIQHTYRVNLIKNAGMLGTRVTRKSQLSLSKQSSPDPVLTFSFRYKNTFISTGTGKYIRTIYNYTTV